MGDFGLAQTARAVAKGSSHVEDDPAPPVSSVGADARPSSETVFGGTPRYMSPEQFLHQTLDARTDQFSFSVALYEALYGRHPFLDDTRLLPMQPRFREAIMRGSPPSAPWQDHGSSRAVGLVVLRGLTRERNQRFSSLRHQVAALRTAVVQPRRRRSRGIIPIGAALMIVAAAILWFSFRRSRSEVVLAGATPADWSHARIVFRTANRIHCLSKVANNTIRVVWGIPRHVSDVELTSGTTTPAQLVPESYQYGCPELSPDGQQLIFEGYDGRDRPHIFHAPHPTGRGAEPVVSSAEPSHQSHPLWLSSNRDFVFDAGFQHPAIFSLETNRSAILSDKDRSANSHMGFQKAVSPLGDRIAIVQNRAHQRSTFINIYQWPGLQLMKTLDMPDGMGQVWEFGRDPTHMFGRIVDTTDQIVLLDAERMTLTRVARAGERHSGVVLELGSGVAAIATYHFEAGIVYDDQAGHERKVPATGAANYAAPTWTESGDIVFSQTIGSVANIRRFRPTDGTFHDLTRGPYDFAGAPLPGGSWLMARHSLPSGESGGIWKCSPSFSGSDPICRRFSTDLPLQSISVAPGSDLFAYAALSGQEIILRLTSLVDGTTRDLVAGTNSCRPIWSSPHTLWFSRRHGRHHRWSEIDVVTGMMTGRVSPGTSNCYNGHPDPTVPVRSSVRGVIVYDTDVRVARLSLPR